MPSCMAIGDSIAYQAKSIGEVTALSKTIEPPEVRARRAATGRARSARADPSRGTKIRLNMVQLL